MLQKIFWVYPRLVLRRFVDEKGFFLAQAIAFKSLITIIPVAILLLGVLGRVFQNDDNRQVVIELLQELVPDYLNGVVLFLDALEPASGTITLLGALGSIVFATVLINTLCEALAVFFTPPEHTPRTFVNQYLLSLRLLLQVGIVFALTILLSFAVQALSAAGLSLLHELGLDYVWVRTGWRRAIKLLGILVPLFLTLLMFFQLYLFIPKPHPPVKSVLLGSMLAAGAWELAKYLFSLYATQFAFFDRLQGGTGNGIEALGDTVGLIIALLIWLYYSGVVLILGGIVVAVHEKRHSSRLERVH